MRKPCTVRVNATHCLGRSLLWAPSFQQKNSCCEQCRKSVWFHLVCQDMHKAQWCNLSSPWRSLRGRGYSADLCWTLKSTWCFQAYNWLNKTVRQSLFSHNTFDCLSSLHCSQIWRTCSLGRPHASKGPVKVKLLKLLEIQVCVIYCRRTLTVKETVW